MRERRQIEYTWIRVTRGLLKGFLACLAVMALVLTIGLAWLFFDSRGLPDKKLLAQFAPPTTVRATAPCFNSSAVAIPYQLLGTNIRSALNVAVSPEDGPGLLSATYRRLIAQPAPDPVSLSERIAQTVICDPGKPLNQHINEIRVEIQLERHFSKRELFTMLANRLYLGDNIVGVESASQHYFHKEPDQLDIAESALLAGLAANPSHYSPIKHPDRALIRRNEVIDAMAKSRRISDSEAMAAKGTPLAIVQD